MLTYDLLSYSMKAVSSRLRLRAGSMLVTCGAAFIVTVEPNCIAVWRPKDDDPGAYVQYTDNQYSADDLRDDDDDFCYVHDDHEAGKQVRAACYSHTWQDTISTL